MGQSLILLRKAPLELSLDIDRGICIEVGTGFQEGSPPYSVNVSISLTVDELAQLISRLTTIHNDLKESWTCPDCKSICHKNWQHCAVCGLKKETL